MSTHLSLADTLWLTSAARFQAARRLRLKEKAGTWGQVIASTALVGWSIAPRFFPGLVANDPANFFSVIASVYLLVASVLQSSSRYVDRARDMESSAREISNLKLLVRADAMSGLSESPETHKSRLKQYRDILEANTINHEQVDIDFVRWNEKSIHWKVFARCYVCARAMSFFLLCILLVIVFPLFILKI